MVRDAAAQAFRPSLNSWKVDLWRPNRRAQSIARTTFGTINGD